MPTITMLYDTARWEEKALIEAAKRKDVPLKPIECKDQYYELARIDRSEYGDIVLQRCVSYFRSLHLTALLEAHGIKVVNGLHEAITAGNKLFTTLALIKAGVPTPRTMLAFTPEGSLAALEELGYPAVIKPVIGSWGRLLALVNDKEAAEAVLEDREHMFPLYQVYYLQEKVNRPPRDIRAFVIGDRVVAAIYRVSPEGSWRTNTSRGGKAVNCPVTKEVEDICLRAARAIGEGIFGVDCMETPDGLVVHEVNNTTEFRNSVPATGVDIPGYIIEYLVEKTKRC
jgi:[lysine-biosynthesis-protein LysW]--L-2-aminoadipate ligase